MPSKQGEVVAKILKNKAHSIGAEIGVWRGTFAFKILNGLPGIQKYYCIDLWKHYDDHTAILRPDGKMAKANMDKVYKTFKEQAKVFGSRIVIYRMTSIDASKIIPDNSLDFVYIDANHAYSYIKEDIKVWTPKVKTGGLVSGHDYGNKRFGVTQAVDEAFSNVKEIDGVWYIWKK